MISRTFGLAGLSIIMLSSERRKGDQARAREWGVVRYLTKPYCRPDLFNCLTAVMGKGSQPSAKELLVQANHPPKLSQGLRILLAEGFAGTRRMIEFFLKSMSCQIETASNGELAVRMFKEGTYDVVLMDLRMPVMDGCSATRAIREWERTQKRMPVPVMALAARASHGEMQRSQAAGCTAHLTKPIRKDRLLEALQLYTQTSSAAGQLR